MSSAHGHLLDLDDVAVVVTGAGRGIGRAHALALAASGARVVVNDVDRDEAAAVVAEIAAAGGTAAASGHSVAEPEECAELVRTCVRTYGRIDGLINNAGIEYRVAPSGDSAERQRALLTVNVLGALWCGTAALPYMLAQGSGSIVNTVSGAAVGVPGLAAYGTSKAALFGLTYAWAAETIGTGVRVNAISPVAATRMSLDDVSPATERIAPVACWLMHPSSAAVHGQVVRFTGDVLGLMAPPRLTAVIYDETGFTAPGIARAFTDDLGDRQEPFGHEALLADAARVRRPAP